MSPYETGSSARPIGRAAVLIRKREVDKRVIAKQRLLKKRTAKKVKKPSAAKPSKPKNGLDPWERIKLEPKHALAGEVFAGNPHHDMVHRLLKTECRIAQDGDVFLLFLKKNK